MSIAGPSLVRCLSFALLLAGAAGAVPPPFLTFESGHVRPLALSPDGERLFAVNTPAGLLEVFDLADGGFEHAASVPVGLEPVAVAAWTNRFVWVTNHLSDSVSIVDVKSRPPRVVRTLLVGDEPRDVVFAGKNRRRAFVTTAHRGQHRSHPSLDGVPGAGDPRLTTPGVPRADVWVFDARFPGPGLGGTPLRIVELYGDTPRALAVSPDGDTVYAAVFLSGNQTATVPEGAVCDGFAATDLEDACPDQLPGVPGGNPGPAVNHQGVPAPEVGLIVKRDRERGGWRDELGRDWSAAIRFDLPDWDVFALDAATLEQVAAYPHVGTVLFDVAVNPVSGKLYVSNTEAKNEVRFEGPGTFGGSTVQGHLHEARITVIADGPEGATVVPRHLNKHLDYSERPAPPGVRRSSLATPLGIAVSADGETLYVAAFGSGKVGVFKAAELEDDSFDPRRTSPRYLEVGGGPTGLVLDEARGRLYVTTRFDNAVTALGLDDGREIARVALMNPEPPEVVGGRPLLYDALKTSSNGEASCGSCHVFGGTDGLAWDLGDPDGDVSESPIPILRELDARAFDPPVNGSGDPADFHPMKGPMMTQTLRGLVASGALHWRGDRATGVFGSEASNPDLALRNFAVAFPGLLGHRRRLSEAQMKKLSDFALALTLPPNPVRHLDNSLTPAQAEGERFFSNRLADGGIGARRCQQCHSLSALRGEWGTRRLQAFIGVPQVFKVPHLRTLYRKVGMFGTAAIDFLNPGANEPMGDQVRGFGVLHDGSIDTLFRFLRARVFDHDGDVGFRDDGERRAVEQFLLAFPTDLAPAVGQQVTVSAASGEEGRERALFLLERAKTPFDSFVLGGVATECELVVKGTLEREARGGLYDRALDRFVLDREAEAPIAMSELLEAAKRPRQEMTFTCVPPGSGVRMGVDRDLDGVRDRDELDAGSDPADPESRSPLENNSFTH